MTPPRDPKTGRFVSPAQYLVAQHLVGIDLTERLHTQLARWPWTRCKARLPKGVLSDWGRCDLVKHHKGEHALERGFDVVWFA